MDFGLYLFLLFLFMIAFSMFKANKALHYSESSSEEIECFSKADKITLNIIFVLWIIPALVMIVKGISFHNNATSGIISEKGVTENGFELRVKDRVEFLSLYGDIEKVFVVDKDTYLEAETGSVFDSKTVSIEKK